MKIMVGSARIDEKGNARGGEAGNNNGKEISEQEWYLHKKGWRVLMAKDRTLSEWIAVAMRLACANKHIGYDQGQRDTLYKYAKKVDFDIAKVKDDCETDCSALVRVCVQYAFHKCNIRMMIPDFRTTNEAGVLLGTGQFVEKKEWQYTQKGDNLPTGTILVTKSQGHTVVVTQGREKNPLLYCEVKKGKWPVYRMPPEQVKPDGYVYGGEKMVLYGTSRLNPDYRAVKGKSVKGYVSGDALEDPYEDLK